MKGRVYLPVDPAKVRLGDVVEYYEQMRDEGGVTPVGYGQRRCHRVEAQRVRGSGAQEQRQVAVRLHDCEGGGRRWIDVRQVARAWRWWRQVAE